MVFLRLSRAVSGGVSAKANIEFARFAQLVQTISVIPLLMMKFTDQIRQAFSSSTWH